MYKMKINIHSCKISDSYDFLKMLYAFMRRHELPIEKDH